MKPSDRRERIVEMLRQHQKVTVESLADILATSRETVRRDLAQLDSKRLLKKVHGGAVAVALPRPDRFEEGPFTDRMVEAAAIKRAIGRRAASLLSSGDSLFIDTGSTTVYFAEQLARLTDLSVITNSASIAKNVVLGNKNKVHLLGGDFRLDGNETVGPTTVEQVEHLRARHVFLTIGGIDQHAVTDFDVQEAYVACAMIRSARSVTVLADSSKFDRQGVFEVAKLSQIDRLVTDAVPDDMRAAIAKAGIEVVLCDETDGAITAPG